MLVGIYESKRLIFVAKVKNGFVSLRKAEISRWSRIRYAEVLMHQPSREESVSVSHKVSDLGIQARSSPVFDALALFLSVASQPNYISAQLPELAGKRALIHEQTPSIFA